MKRYEVMQDFKGSPDGHTVIQLTKGDEIEHAQIGDDLAEVALAEKWVKPSKAAEKEAKAKARAEADRIEAEEKAAAEAKEAKRAAAHAALTEELAQLEADYEAAFTADPSGKTAEPIKTAWEAKQAELAAL